MKADNCSIWNKQNLDYTMHATKWKMGNASINHTNLLNHFLVTSKVVFVNISQFTNISIVNDLMKWHWKNFTSVPEWRATISLSDMPRYLSDPGLLTKQMMQKSFFHTSPRNILHVPHCVHCMKKHWNYSPTL